MYSREFVGLSNTILQLDAQLASVGDKQVSDGGKWRSVHPPSRQFSTVYIDVCGALWRSVALYHNNNMVCTCMHHPSPPSICQEIKRRDSLSLVLSTIGYNDSQHHTRRHCRASSPLSSNPPPSSCIITPATAIVVRELFIAIITPTTAIAM